MQQILVNVMNGAIYITPDVISSTQQQHENSGAVYSIPGLNANITLWNELVKKVVPHMKTVDFMTNRNQVMFFGDNVRGTLMAIG